MSVRKEKDTVKKEKRSKGQGTRGRFLKKTGLGRAVQIDLRLYYSGFSKFEVERLREALLKSMGTI
jgi:hypothetical protein